MCDRAQVKALLLSRMANGVTSAMVHSAPMNRLFFVPRGAALSYVVRV
jgi:hypothetical protein